MKLQNHLHYTDFKNKSLQQKKDAEEKTNGNNVGSQEQRRQLTSNENMISLMECYEIVGGLNK